MIGDMAAMIGSATREAAGSGAVEVMAVAGLRVAGMLLLLLLVMQVLRGASAATRHAVWRAGFVMALVLPVVAAALPWRLELLPERAAVLQPPVSEQEEGSALWIARDEVVGQVAPSESRSQAEASRTGDGEGVGPAFEGEASGGSTLVMGDEVAAGVVRRAGELAGLLPVIWMVGALLLALRLLAGHLAVSRILAAGRRAEGTGWTSPLYEAADILGVAVDVELVLSDRVTMPFTAGIRRPAIVLPESAGGWELERRRAVLMHELAHIRRGDLFSHHVARWVCALHWFNPLAWMAARRMRADSERAADDLVLNAGTRASDYADHLLQIVSGAGRSPMPAPALPLAQRREFEGRVLAILEPGIRRRVPGRVQSLAVTALVLLLTFPLAALDRAESSMSGVAAPEKGEAGSSEDAATEMRETDPERAWNTNQDRDSNRNGNTNRNGNSDSNAGMPQPAPFPESFRVHIDAVEPAASPQPKTGPVGTLAQDAVDAAMPLLDMAFDAGIDLAVPALVRTLTDVDVSVRQAVVQALGDLDDPRAIQALMRILLEDPVADVRAAAAWALGEIEDPAALPALMQALQRDSSAEVRQRAAWALGEIEDARAVDALGAALRDADSEVRHTAMWALGEIESPAAVPALLTGLSSDDSEVRSMSAWALGQIEDAAAVVALIRVLREDRSAEVREHAARALGEIEDVRAVEALALSLNDPAPAVREAAMWALAQLDSPAAAPALVRALADSSYEIRAMAAFSLGESDLDAAPAALIRALEDEHPDVRAAAAHALGEICDPAAVGALTRAMSDSNEEVRMAAIHALVDMDSDEASAAMIQLLDHEDPDVRRKAAQALGNK